MDKDELRSIGEQLSRLSRDILGMCEQKRVEKEDGDDNDADDKPPKKGDKKAAMKYFLKKGK